ncbi:ATPase domain-containing protein [Marinivivus vitaminiproducens]|uniref:ATPase domain-containing protein n=1 Tax=Marinivivus vitaminiproducens TaxID=3035935 RepID=UPI0027A89D63|nr:ATPase domain-containing protein [Geminicoccaceae bacterium SCSIO 64248]
MPSSLKRLETGIPGLDRILGGGLVAGSSYIVQGRPGSGKTILANQIAFRHATAGHHVLYVTLLSEAHDRLFLNLSTLSFFDAERVGSGIDYVSAFLTMQDGGLAAVITLLRREIEKTRSSLLILDGLLHVSEQSPSGLDMKTFVAELQGYAALADCTCLLLTSGRLEPSSPEHTMVDGVIDLDDRLAGSRSIRRLEVTKSRGSGALRGVHMFEITQDGIVVYPRLEAAFAQPSAVDVPLMARLSSGVIEFDALLGGGVTSSSFTLLIGPSGSGKTTLGLHFLAKASTREPALHFGFYETPERLSAKARAFGLDLDTPRKTGALEVLWQPPTENLLDALGHRLLDAVRRRGVKRLLVDGLGGFERAAVDRDRMVEFFTALGNELRALGVTTLATWELRQLFGTDVTAPSPEVSSIVENLVLLRFVERDSDLKRELSILKLRDSPYDMRSYELTMGVQGITLVRN